MRARHVARLLGALALLLLPIAAPRIALADDISEQARVHNSKAEAAYALGKFGVAATAYEEAFELKPQPALLYNAAQSHRLAGNKERALALYQSYLRVYGTRISNKVEVNTHISILRKAIDAEARATSSPPLTPAPTERDRHDKVVTPEERSALPPARRRTEERTETKPAETKPAETKPAETKPVEPTETKPIETRPTETKPAEDRKELTTPPAAASSGSTPITKKPAFWGVFVGAVVVVGAVVGVGVGVGLSGGERDPTPTGGSITFGLR